MVHHRVLMPPLIPDHLRHNGVEISEWFREKFSFLYNDEFIHNLAVVAIKDIYVILDICFRRALFLSEFELFYEYLATFEI